MTQTVTMPDGTLHNFPDEATPDMISGALGLQSSAPSALQNAGTAAGTAFLGNAMGQNSSPALGALEALGAGAGSLIKSAAAPVMQGISNIEAPAAQGIANAIDSPESEKLAQQAQSGLSSIGSTISGAEKQYPEAARVAGIGNILPVGDVLDTAGNAARTIGETPFVKNIAEDWNNPPLGVGASGSGVSTPKIQLTRPMIKAASQNAYQYANDTGGVLHPDTFTNDVMDMVDAARPKPLPSGKFTAEQTQLNNALDDFSNERGYPMTLEQFQNFDRALGDKESALMNGFKSTTNSRIMGNLQDAARARLQALSPDDVVGGKEGFDALTQHAIPLWSTQAKMADLETIINRANMMDNPSTAMRTGFRNLSLNDAKMAQYPQEVQDLIRKAAQTGKMDDVLGIIGSRLNPIIAGAAGPLGMPVSMVTSAAARGVRNAMKNSQADQIMSAMTEPVRASVERFTPAEASSPPKLLTYQPIPAEPVTMTGNSYGQTVAMTPGNRTVIGQGAGTAMEQAPSVRAAQSGANPPLYQEPLPKVTPDDVAAARQAGMDPTGYAAMRQSALAGEPAPQNGVFKTFTSNPAGGASQPIGSAEGKTPDLFSQTPKHGAVSQFPVRNFIRQQGGVRVGSNLDAEMRNMGITPQSAPGLFKKSGGLGDVDNFPSEEWKLGAHPTDETGNYVDRQHVLDELRREMSPNAGGRSSVTAGSKDDLEIYARSLGVNTEGKSYGDILESVKEREAMISHPANHVSSDEEIPFKRGGAVQPTEKQKEAGNYKKEHIKIHGLDISIENPRGSIRSGKDKSGKEWSVKMAHPYGYFKRTEGKDGDHVDCFIGPNKQSLRVYIVDQKNDAGNFDEHKVMLCYPTREAAIQAYRDSFSDKKNRIMHVRKMLIPEFKDWLKNGNTKKPIKAAA